MTDTLWPHLVTPGDLVAGKRVAIVCNAPEALQQTWGVDIDKHDVVIRMNRGFPTKPSHRIAIGFRTDVLTGGRIDPLDDIPCTPKMVWWTKHTAMGDIHKKQILAHRKFQHIPFWHMPTEFRDLLAAQIGANSSSAPAVLHICQHFGARSIELFGLSCWGKLEAGKQANWWNDQDLSFFHSPEREAAWFRERVEQVAPFCYRVKA
jgi:hypothetical protein